MVEGPRSDHIGRIGENFFDELANKAKLLVGQILPDRIGRDRILEFELESIGSESYDMRSPPLGCSLQVKTILDTNNRVLLSLPVAERLLGDTRPTFVCIIRIDQCDSVVDLYLVHLWGENLGRILKRLRAESSKGSQKLNKKKISFNISAGSKVELTPQALKRALREMIDVDMETYSQQKIIQRNSLGFESRGRFSAKVSFELGSTEELVDGILGLGKLKVNSFNVFEERFKIKLPFNLPVPLGLQGGTFEA